jgi:hypothetical protein
MNEHRESVLASAAARLKKKQYDVLFEELTPAELDKLDATEFRCLWIGPPTRIVKNGSHYDVVIAGRERRTGLTEAKAKGLYMQATGCRSRIAELKDNEKIDSTAQLPFAPPVPLK